MADIRDKSASLLSSTLSALSSDINTANDQARALESAVNDKYSDTGNDYRKEIRELSLDLGKNNTELGQEVANGQIDAKKVVNMSNEQMKTDERAKEDNEMREQGLKDSIGEGKIPVHDGARGQGPAAASANDLSQEGEVGIHEASMGEEGDFKARGQPKIQGLEGIEFETGV